MPLDWMGQEIGAEGAMYPYDDASAAAMGQGSGTDWYGMQEDLAQQMLGQAPPQLDESGYFGITEGQTRSADMAALGALLPGVAAALLTNDPSQVLAASERAGAVQRGELSRLSNSNLRNKEIQMADQKTKMDILSTMSQAERAKFEFDTAKQAYAESEEVKKNVGLAFDDLYDHIIESDTFGRSATPENRKLILDQLKVAKNVAKTGRIDLAEKMMMSAISEYVPEYAQEKELENWKRSIEGFVERSNFLNSDTNPEFAKMLGDAGYQVELSPDGNSMHFLSPHEVELRRQQLEANKLQLANAGRQGQLLDLQLGAMRGAGGQQLPPPNQDRVETAAAGMDAFTGLVGAFSGAGQKFDFTSQEGATQSVLKWMNSPQNKDAFDDIKKALAKAGFVSPQTQAAAVADFLRQNQKAGGVLDPNIYFSQLWSQRNMGIDPGSAIYFRQTYGLPPEEQGGGEPEVTVTP